MNYIKQDSIVIYIDLDKSEILSRANAMKLDRIIGQKTKSLSEILDYRRKIYDNNYDYRILIGIEEKAEITVKRMLNLLNTDDTFISTRGNEKYDFYDVISLGLANDGGLFLPSSYFNLDLNQWKRLVNLNYKERYRYLYLI